MKLRTQLILALSLLSVVPLAGVSLYSYQASIRAFRQAVQQESSDAAADMRGRMESARGDLHRRIQHLGDFPFRRLLARNRDTRADAAAPMEQLMSEMGEIAPFIDSLEFTPADTPEGNPPEPHKPQTSPPPPAKVAQPDGLVIQISPDVHEAASSIERRGNRSMMHLRLPEVRLTDKNVQEEWKKATQEALEELKKNAAELQKAAQEGKAVEIAKKMSEIRANTREVSRGMRHSLAGDFSSAVKVDGELVGTVRAQVRTREILYSVLRRTRRQQGEIPFAVDQDGKIYVADPADQPKIEALQLPGREGEGTSRASGNWVVVTRKGGASNVTFGIARPIASRLDELRLTAARNLGLGMGIVGLALIGIIPLSNRMTRSLSRLTEGAEKLARGDLDTRIEVRRKDEIGRLAETFNRMARDLNEHQNRLLEQERLQKELELCRRIQEELLPHTDFRFGVVEAKGISIPAREVGGDFFNYFAMPEGTVALLVGDVSGKGLPAALLMANLQATLQARMPLESDLARLAERLDAEIGDSTPPEVYLTLFMGVLDTVKGELRYVNAGHNSQFALRSNGGMMRLESTGRPLGLLPGGGYQEERIRLDGNDSIFLYTDGLVESENEAGEEFGMGRLESLLTRKLAGGVSGVLVAVEEEVRRFRGGVDAADDATLVLVKVGGPASPPEPGGPNPV